MLEVYKFLDADLLRAGVIIHDLEKINELNAGAAGVATEYTRDGLLLGHIVQGVVEIDRVGRS
jgi:3'-5' exoribonuclease